MRSRVLLLAVGPWVASGFSFAAPGAPVLKLDAAGLQWSPVAACTGYDVVRGDLSDLLATDGDFAAATSTCAANDVVATSLDDADSPPAGEGFFYLVRSMTCHAVGTWDSGSPSQQGSRDAEIAAAPNSQPCNVLPDPGDDGKIGIVRSYIQTHHAPPMAGIAVVSDSVLKATAGLGGADGQTLFWIASTSKFVSAVGAVTLMQEGLLDQNAPVTGYVEDYGENNGLEDQILIEHLLQNRSGLPQDGGCANFACRQDLPGDATTTQYDLMLPDRGATLGNIFRPEMLAKVPYSIFNATSFPPGGGYQYAGWGWMLAGRAMEIAAVQTFDVLMQQRVLDPAGMCRATYDGSTVDSNAALGTGSNAIDGWCLEPMLPPGHRGEGQPYYHDELDCAARMPQGGLHASALDLGRLAEAVLQDLAGAGRVTADAAMRQVFCPDGGQGVPGAPGSICLGRGQVTGSHATLYGSDYGFGNFRRTYVHAGRTYDLYNHGGSRAGFSSYFALVPEAGFAIAVVVNDETAAAWHDVAECAIRVYLHGAGFC